MQLLQNNSVSLEQQRLNNDSVMANLGMLRQAGSPGGGRPHHQPSGHGRNNGFHAKGPDPLLNIRYPVGRKTPITDGYGPRINPVTHRQSDHTGIDFGASLGTPVRAAQSGFVKQANPNDPIYGNQIVLGHGHGYQTMYGHMENYIVKPGQKVHRGQVIGYVGSTGWSTGPHLHFETWVHGSPVNPIKFLG